MKPLSEGFKASLGVACLVVVLLVAASFGGFQRREQLDSRQWVIHTYHVLQELEGTASALALADASQRDYLHSFSENDAAIFKAYAERAQQKINALVALTTDNPEQQQRILLLSDQVNAKLATMTAALIAAREGHAGAMQKKLPALSSGGANFGSIKYVFDEIEEAERRLLEQRTKALTESTRSGNVTLAAFLILAVGAVLLVSFFLRKYMMVRYQLQQELRSRAHQLQLILDNMSDGVILADKSGHFLLSNPAAERLIGTIYNMPPEKWSEHFGLYLPDMKTPFPSDQLPLARSLRGENVDDEDIYVKSPSRSGGLWMNVTSRPIVDDDNVFEGAIVVIRDVSQRKEAEQRVSEFYSTVSHELRTPLTSIRGSLGLIEGGITGEISENTMQLVQIARTESDRLIRLINDILDIGKLEAGKLQLRKSPIESELLLTRTLDGVRGMASERNVILVADVKTGGQLTCDVDRIIQVLTNLVSNAIKFSHSGKEVLVALTPGANQSFKFSVTDQGIGIAQKDMPKLFGKFQQIDQSDARQEAGTGLGLSIAKSIVEEHGGVIGVESEPGVGSTFWFELPTSFSPQLVSRTAAGQRSAGATTYSGKRPALIVEDDQALAKFLSTHLTLDGFEVAHAGTIAEAVKVLDECVPLVVLLDLNLPDGSGLDVLTKLNALPDTRSVPVIMITGSTPDPQGYGHPTLLDWITKPFDDQRLHKALDLVRSKGGGGKILVVEDDPSTRKVIKEQLRTLGVECREAATGNEAIREIKEQQPDLLILDLAIPAPAGGELIEMLKKEGNDDTLLIVYTASDLTQEQKESLTLGLTAHLTKSRTTQEQLLNTVRGFMNRLLISKAEDGKEPSA